jgi:GNAT superfamily N-acetyltransferase
VPLQIPLPSFFHVTQSSYNHHVAFHSWRSRHLLAGVAVSPAFQRQGIARLLLSSMTCKLNHDTYTFPYQHLTSLYQSVGFTLIGSEQSLPAVAELCRKYRNQGRNIFMMVYGGNSMSEQVTSDNTNSKEQG